MAIVTATTGCSLFLGDGDGSDAGDAGDAADATVPCPLGAKRVFVTSAVYPPTLPEAADEVCLEHAGGGDWRAWLSTAQEDAIDRVADVGPWCLMNRSAVVFESKLALEDVPQVPINVFEDGRRFTPNDVETGVWTGTNLGGVAAADHCTSWTTTESTEEALLGRLDNKAALWTAHQTVGCGSELRLYCFEQ